MADKTFYATAAQVIPVLLLALLFEQRLFEKADPRRSTNVFLVALLVVLGVGEIAAINSLLDNHPPRYAKALVLAGINFGLIALILPIMRTQVIAAAELIPTRFKGAVRVAGYFALATFIVLNFVLDSETVFTVTALGVFFVLLTISVVVRDLEDWRERRVSDDDAPSGDSA